MAPVWQKIEADAITPYYNREIQPQAALERAWGPLREFLFKQTRKADLALFTKNADPASLDPAQVPATSVIPAFMISELKTAFQMAFLIYVPFLVLDLVVASILMSMGMMFLPPVLVSLPFKLVLFVLVDGWNLLVASLLRSFA
jgi:flagellar biosynthetic protein FliP